MRLRLALLGAVLLLACEPTDEAAQSRVLAGPASPAATNGCPSAGPAVGDAYPPQAIANSTASYVRTCDRAGGWSLELPPGWFERSSPQHGHELLSYDPSGMVNNGGSNPPADGVFVRLQMMQNLEQFDLVAFAISPMKGRNGNVREHRQVMLAGQPAEFYAVPSYWSSIETDLFWYVKSPFFADRVVVIMVVRAESPLRADAERLVASLQFFQPTAVNFVPTISRSEIISRVSSRPGLALTRIEARLVLRKDLDATGHLGRDYYSDPDALAWVVAYSGAGIHGVNFGGGFGVAPAIPRASEVCLSTADIYPADGQPAMTASGGCDTKSAWPVWFDALPDRAH